MNIDYKRKYEKYLNKYNNLDNYLLNDYFCSSSHNSYLEAGQLIGSSSAEQYIEILKEGCRHVELDVYDGKEPIIKHSIAPTGNVLLRDILQKIIDFHNSNKLHTPIILNIENNCKKDCDKIHDLCSSMMKDILSPRCTCLINYPDVMEQYKMKNYLDKIIIRDRPKNMKNIVGISKLTATEKKEVGIFNFADTISKNVNFCPCSTISLNYADIVDELMLNILFDHKKSYTQRVEAYKRCLIFIKKTRFMTTRSYPPGKHIKSGNYNTIVCMSLGINYPAINFQVNDKYKQMNMSLFSQSDGYLLKPTYLRKGEIVFEKHMYVINFVSTTVNEMINVKLYSGFYTMYMIDKEKLSKKNFRLNNRFEFLCYESSISVLYISTDKLNACLPISMIKKSGLYKLKFYSHKKYKNNLNNLNILHKLNNLNNLNKYNDGLDHLKISDDFKKYYDDHLTSHEIIISINVDN